MKKFFTKFSLPIITYLAIQVTAANPTEDLNVVGEARLKFVFWQIYKSTLYSTSGDYQGLEPDLTLQINYRRKISLEQLISRTREEWQKMSFLSDQIEQWLTELKAILPNVEKGDVIILKVDEELRSNFYFNSSFVGRIDSPIFTKAFLDIWLSEKGSYPELQKQLTGRKG